MVTRSCWYNGTWSYRTKAWDLYYGGRRSLLPAIKALSRASISCGDYSVEGFEARRVVKFSKTHGAVRCVVLESFDVADGTLGLIPSLSETFLEVSDSLTVQRRETVAACELEAVDVELVA
jgi:hypothetical protein